MLDECPNCGSSNIVIQEYKWRTTAKPEPLDIVWWCNNCRAASSSPKAKFINDVDQDFSSVKDED